MFDFITDDEFADYGYYAEDMWSDSDYDMTDVEADADTLASAGWGTDEDYYYGGEDAAYEAGLLGWDA